jgi:hypothetical protein
VIWKVPKVVDWPPPPAPVGFVTRTSAIVPVRRASGIGTSIWLLVCDDGGGSETELLAPLH